MHGHKPAYGDCARAAATIRMPRGVTARHFRRGLSVLAVLLLAVGTSMIGVTRSRADPGGPFGGCTSVKVVGIRGSGEDFGDSDLGMGPELYTLYQQVVQSLPGIQVSGSGLYYAAVPWTSLDLFASIGTGAVRLAVAMDAEAQACPGEKSS